MNHQVRRVSHDEFMRESEEWARQLKRQRRKDFVQAAFKSVWAIVVFAVLGLAATVLYQRAQALNVSAAQDMAAIAQARQSAQQAAQQERQEYQAIEAQQAQ